MFDIKCQTVDTTTITALKQFQGNLKKRTSEDIDALINSINNDGLLMPIAIWNHDGVCEILDGHARYEAFVRMAIDDPAILEAELPVILVKAADENEARRMLLQITSSYGKVNKSGLREFVALIPDYKIVAPIVKSVSTVIRGVETPKVVEPSDVVLRIRIKKDLVPKLTSLLGSIEGVTVL
jgi:hypothetical protein